MRTVRHNGRTYYVREDNMLVDVITGAALGFGLDALLGAGDNLDGAVLGGIGAALGGPVGGIVGGLLGGLFDD